MVLSELRNTTEAGFMVNGKRVGLNCKKFQASPKTILLVTAHRYGTQEIEQGKGQSEIQLKMEFFSRKKQTQVTERRLLQQLLILY